MAVSVQAPIFLFLMTVHLKSNLHKDRKQLGNYFSDTPFLHYRTKNSPDFIFYTNKRFPINLLSKSQRNKKKENFTSLGLSRKLLFQIKHAHRLICYTRCFQEANCIQQFTLQTTTQPLDNPTDFLQQKKPSLKQTTSQKVLNIAKFT